MASYSEQPTLTAADVSSAIRRAAEEVGSAVSEMAAYYRDGGRWDAESPDTLAALLVECWREQAAQS